MKSLPRLVVLISGTGTNLQALINASATGVLGANLVHVISNRADAQGLQRAKVARIPTSTLVFAPFKDSPNPKIDYDLALAKRVNEQKPDLIILAGFMRILTPHFLKQIPAPIFNLHPALPGCYSGLNAMERAWSDFEMSRVDHSGVMVHKVVEEVDMGPTVGKKVVPMTDFQTFEQFKNAMHAAEHHLLVDVVREWCSAFTHT